MTEETDYRTDPMESPEGRGIAMSRLDRWKVSIPEELYGAVARAEAELEDAGYYEPDFDDEGNYDEGVSAIEEADLIGFWIAWHRAGGFSSLRSAGWHRATIYRKIKAFRDHFGEHPDTYVFSWLKVDLKKLWLAELTEPITVVEKAHRSRSISASTTSST